MLNVHKPTTATVETGLVVCVCVCLCAGKDYPRPIVSHIEASQRNLGLMRQVRTEQQTTAELTRGKIKQTFMLDAINRD